MNIDIQVGDVLLYPADLLIATANPWLNLSGGVNGAILAACGEVIQRDLHDQLSELKVAAVPPGSILHTGAYGLPFRHILHAVAIDPFYDSSIELVRQTFTSALKAAVELGAKTVTSPTLATGYGPLSIQDFGHAVAGIADERFSSLSVTIVVRSDEVVEQLRQGIDGDR
ncbi:Appr-1-p processing protein [Bremerella cremea]|uniref:Appr-1-p processing protein n=1 Tax=Bremerella cremea TaxID=1031537 RepID=A0A368KPX0_9BACT|nr:macro domain-containing protein [Bremerella cremea]RCS43214.1 Appr-1-p processing protein [Bremerella cremea]